MFKSLSRISLPFLVLTITMTLQTQAQSTNAVAKAFAGQWITFDTAHSGDGNCTFTFSEAKQGELYPIKPANCLGDVASVAGWRIQNNQLILARADASPLAVVGGNQERLSGSMVSTKAPLIIEKYDLAQKIAKARKSIGCSYVGYSQTCATPRQFSPPPATVGAPASLKILVNLNARTEPRNNARIVTVLKPQTCVSATVCSLASDGLWCKIKAEDKEAWIKKQAVRQKKWPIITFENDC